MFKKHVYLLLKCGIFADKKPDTLLLEVKMEPTTVNGFLLERKTSELFI